MYRVLAAGVSLSFLFLNDKLSNKNDGLSCAIDSIPIQNQRKKINLCAFALPCFDFSFLFCFFIAKQERSDYFLFFFSTNLMLNTNIFSEKPELFDSWCNFYNPSQYSIPRSDWLSNSTFLFYPKLKNENYSIQGFCL